MHCLGSQSNSFKAPPPTLVLNLKRMSTVAVVAPVEAATATPDEEACMPTLPTNKSNALYFFGTEGPYGFLSNFSYYPFKINGISWKTVEHYYQTQKFAGTDLESSIRVIEDPALVKQFAKKHSAQIRPDWEQIQEQVMLAALIAKFVQNSDASDLLLDTQNAFLVEHSKKDSYWGDGHANGLNRLGALLMHVRQLIRAQLGIPEPTEEYKKPSKTDGQLRKMLDELMAQSEQIDAGVLDNVAPKIKRRIKTKPGTPSKPFRYADGSSVFEKDFESGQISVQGTPILVSTKALTPAARTVVFLDTVQKSKKFKQSPDMELDEEEEEDEESSPSDIELEMDYLPPSTDNSNDTLADHTSLIEDAEILIAMGQSSWDKKSADFKALIFQLATVKSALTELIEQQLDEPTFDRILKNISSISEIVDSSS